MLMYVILIAGFVLLIKGADFFVDGSSSVAKSLKIPSLIIGMTIVAMGTSLPETSVSVSASLSGANDLSISNAVGSNIFNLMVVAGLCAVFCAIPVSSETIKRDFPISIIAAIMLALLGWTGSTVGHIEGLILLAVFAGFLFLMVRSAIRARNNSTEIEEYSVLPIWKCALYLIGGIAAIAVGGKMVVDSATDIAKHFGMSENLIGMTIVAFGTSLPELVTSIVAARKKETDMAMGNVIGSNIFNLLFVLGIAASISPIGFTEKNIIDVAVLIGVSLLVLILCAPKKRISRPLGAFMVVIYAAYTVYLLYRENVIGG